MTTSLYWSVRAVDAVEWACVLCGHAFKMTEWEEQRICIKFCIKLEHSSAKTIGMIQRATAMGNWWLAALSQQLAHSCNTSHLVQGFLVKYQITQVTQPRYIPDLAPCNTFEREEISDCHWASGKWNQVAGGNSNKGFCRVFWTVEETLAELCEVPMVTILKGPEASLPYE